MTREVSATPHCVNTLGNKFLRLGRNTQGRDRPWPAALVTQNPNFGVEKIIRPRKHPKPLFGWHKRSMGLAQKEYGPVVGSAIHDDKERARHATVRPSAQVWASGLWPPCLRPSGQTAPSAVAYGLLTGALAKRDVGGLGRSLRDVVPVGPFYSCVDDSDCRPCRDNWNAESYRADRRRNLFDQWHIVLDLT